MVESRVGNLGFLRFSVYRFDCETSACLPDLLVSFCFSKAIWMEDCPLCCSHAHESGRQSRAGRQARDLAAWESMRGTSIETLVAEARWRATLV